MSLQLNEVWVELISVVWDRILNNCISALSVSTELARNNCFGANCEVTNKVSILLAIDWLVIRHEVAITGRFFVNSRRQSWCPTLLRFLNLLKTTYLQWTRSRRTKPNIWLLQTLLTSACIEGWQQISVMLS